MLSELATHLLERCSFPVAGERIDCAVSGGADSLGLLALATFAGLHPVAYHVDHGLREGSQDEAGVVRAAAEELGAEFVSLRVVCAPGPNLEARARAARFGVLPKGVATGHTADDQAETVLLNMMRGASLDGLCGMSKGPTHPILSLRRAECASLVSSLGLVAVEDPSNTDPSFKRNRVRHELLPLMCGIAGRDIVPLLLRQSDLMRDDAAMLDELAADVDTTNVIALRDLPVSLARRAIRRWLRDLDPTAYLPDAAAIERILSVARGEIVACEISEGRRIKRSHGRLISSP